MLNNLTTHCLGYKKIRKILLQINSSYSVKWFYTIDTIVEKKLGLQYEPGNLDVNKVCLAK